MKKTLFLLLCLLLPLFSTDHLSVLNKMAGRKVTISYRFYDKSITGDLKEVNDSGIVIYTSSNERLYILFDAIASVQEHRQN